MGLNKPISVGGGLTAAEVQTTVQSIVDAQTTAISEKVDAQTNTLKTDIPSSISGGASISDINAALDEKLPQYAGDSLHSIWLNDYKTYGEGSYVFKDKNIWNELLRQYEFVNDSALFDNVLTMADSDKKIGYALSALYGSGLSAFRDDITDFETAIKTKTLVNAIANSPLVNVIYNSEAATNARNKISSDGSYTVQKVVCNESPSGIKTINSEGKLIFVKSIGINVINTGVIGPQASVSFSLYDKSYSQSIHLGGDSTPVVELNLPTAGPLDISYTANNSYFEVYVEYIEISD